MRGLLLLPARRKARCPIGTSKPARIPWAAGVGPGASAIRASTCMTPPQCRARRRARSPDLLPPLLLTSGILRAKESTRSMTAAAAGPPRHRPPAPPPAVLRAAPPPEWRRSCECISKVPTNTIDT
eukprot:6655207-Prymnesium_polylepis.1